MILIRAIGCNRGSLEMGNIGNRSLPPVRAGITLRFIRYRIEMTLLVGALIGKGKLQLQLANLPVFNLQLTVLMNLTKFGVSSLELGVD